MVGYSNTTRNYKLLNPEENEIIISPNVKFNENEVGYTNIMNIDHKQIDELYSFQATNNEDTEMIEELPKTYNDCKNDVNWNKAMEKELNSLKKLKDFEEIYEELNVNKMETKWVYTRKDNGDYKAKLVARGFMDRDQEFKTFVVNYEALRLFLTMVTKKKLELNQIDVKRHF